MVKYLIALVLVLGAAYGLIEAWPLIQGPSLTIDSPQEAGSYPGGIVSIRGRTERASELRLNGAPLLKEENGDFATLLTFPRGGSILTFVAADRFGRRITETRTIYVP